MRRILACVLVSAVLAVSLQASAAPDAGRLAPKNLREVGERLDDLASRIQSIVEEASKDPDALRIEIYASYTPDQMKKTRGRVRAEDLVKWMVDPTKNFLTVREAAMKALKEGAQFRGDPDLSRSLKQGSRSRRAYFCEKFLIKHLASDNRLTRGLVHQLLTDLWGNTGITEINRYKPNIASTHKPAIRKWPRFLRRN